MMDSCPKFDHHDDADVVQVLDLNQWRGRYFENDIDWYLGMDMASLGTLILLEKSVHQLTAQNSEDENDIQLQRLSLAYERLHSMPKILLEQLAHTVKILDLSYNEFDKLDFLEEFSELTTLICDHNNINSDCYLPYLPKLEFLWMNHCKILDLYRWIYKLSNSCPNLKYLSLLNNPGAQFNLYARKVKEQIQYRLFVLSLFPKLLHLDDKPVTNEERKKSRKLYQKHVIDILTTKVQQNLPDCVRRASRKMSLMLSNENLSNIKRRNYIV